MHTEQKNEINIASFLMFRFLPYWPVLVLFAVGCLAAAYAYLKIALPTYEAYATLLIKDEKKGSDDARMIEALNVFGTKKIVENEIEVIKSRALIKEVVLNLALYAPISMEKEVKTISAYVCSPVIVFHKDPENLKETEKVYFEFDTVRNVVRVGKQEFVLNTWVESPYGTLQFKRNQKLKYPTIRQLYFSLIPVKKVVTHYQTKLGVSAANKLSSVVILNLADQVPERAEDVLNELISSYNKAGINDKNVLADNTLTFIEERLNHVKSEVDSVDKQIQEFRSSQGAVNLSEQSTLFLKNVGENDQRIAVLNTQLAVLNKVYRSIQAGQSSAGIAPSTLGVEDPILAQLLNRLSAAEIEYQKLKTITAENNPVLLSLSNEINQIKPSILESINVQKVNLSARINQLKETNTRYAQALNTIPEKERRLLEISRQKTIINNVYDFLLQKKEETAISYASTVPDSRVLDVAESSIKPVSPKKIIVFGGAIFLSLVLTIIFVVLKDFISSSLLFRSELSDIAPVPVWGEINEQSSKKPNPEVLRRQIFAAIANMGILSPENTGKRILTTSSRRGEGKSFVAHALAQSLVANGKRVILLDMDFQGSNPLSGGTNATLYDYLTGKANAAQLLSQTSIEGLLYIAPGKNEITYAQLFNTGKLFALLDELYAQCDFIILDTSYLDPVSDSLLLANVADHVLVVGRHRVTSKAIMKERMTQILAHAKSRVGFVFNGVKSRGFLKGPGFGYGNESFQG
ncbi:MAG: Wzz/FepE/Etk N-terminal domain-containing protein [Cytophagaceae bacterium]|nr:Wzz/FepE/Etk N-terminal domain-containing protein [Cytophagaceae bacterium]